MFVSKGYGGIYYLYHNNPKTGKRTKISTGTTKRYEAQNFLREFERKGGQDELKIKSNPFVLSSLKGEVLDYVKVNCEHKTFEMYSIALRNVLAFLGNRQVESLTLRDFERYKAYRANLVSRTTVNIELRTLKAAFYTAVRLGLIQKNPIVGVKQFTIPQKERLSLNNIEVRLLLNNIDKEVIRNVVLFALYTGCRLSEIINLQVKDLDFERMILIIRNKPNFKTKTGKTRQIPISNELYNLLSKVCFKEDSVKQDEDYLFTLFQGKRLTKDYVSRRFKRYLRKTGLSERYHFHCLRHTFITNLIKNGVSINYVKELAGHTEIQTTMNYIHIGVDDLRGAVNSIKVAV